MPAVIPHLLSLLACGCLVQLINVQTQTMILVIVLGQAHFAMAYLYQYKVGKVDSAYILRYLIYGMLVAGVYHCSGRPFFALDIITSMYFILHFLYDERYLLRKEGTPEQSWLEILPLFIAYAGYLFRSKGDPSYGLFCISLAGLLCVIRFVQAVREGRLSLESLYMTSITIFFLGMLYTKGLSTEFAYIHIIVLAHYANWYFSYFLRWYRSNQWKKLKQFTVEVFLINGLSTGLFVLFYTYDIGILAYVYTPVAFFLWTWMHYLSTLRPADKKAWIRVSSSSR